MSLTQKEVRKVWIGSQHIEQGIRRSKTHCPVALAINERGFGPATVDMDYIEGGRLKFPTPPQLVDAILAFDEGRDVQPFGFDWPK